VGSGTARAAHGARVALVDIGRSRREGARDETKGFAEVEPVVIAANAASEDDVERAAAVTLEASGQINGMLNVARITRGARISK